MESLDAYRRAKDDKNLDKHKHSNYPSRELEVQPRQQRRDSYENHRDSRQGTPYRPTSQRGGYHRDESRGSLGDNRRTAPASRGGFNENDSRSKTVGSRNEVSHLRVPATLRISQSQTNVHSRLGERIWVEKGSQSQLSHTPPPRPPREPMINNQEVESSLERRSALERISQPVARMLLPDGDDQNIQLAPLSQDRLPVLQRIALPQANERVPLLHNGVANSDSGRLQEVEVQYMEDTFPMHILNTSGNPSSSRPPAKERLSLLQVSPIRSLSSDRAHLDAGLRIGSPLEENSQEGHALMLQTATTNGRKTSTAKAAGKV
ncbi:hypothetical protein Bca52824_082494 [Brassica carinata]|uniref:Uncharacterized protein n=1 Tax=Brassica carinata TaxID=52824 RepID=A0A8X7PK26_BRACI|nr:hypothetical protein Bca52824_082494 [Brassica carinata]